MTQNIRSLIDHEDYRQASLKAGLDPAQADKILESYLHDIQPDLDSTIIIHTLGVPSSGKSTYIRNRDTSGMLILSFDSIMESIPQYQQDKNFMGLEYAFQRWELCARAIGYELLFRAITRRLTIMFEHSGARTDHILMLNCLKQHHGYSVHLVFIDTPEDIAIARATQRERYLPPHYIPERRKILESLLPEYQALADHFETVRAQ
jgi:predicted kinase